MSKKPTSLISSLRFLVFFSVQEVRMSRKTREAEKRRAKERRILRGGREKVQFLNSKVLFQMFTASSFFLKQNWQCKCPQQTRPNTVYTSVIERHISGRWDNMSSELPPTEDLAWELRAFEPVKRAYRDNGYDFWGPFRMYFVCTHFSWLVVGFMGLGHKFTIESAEHSKVLN